MYRTVGTAGRRVLLLPPSRTSTIFTFYMAYNRPRSQRDFTGTFWFHNQLWEKLNLSLLQHISNTGIPNTGWPGHQATSETEPTLNIFFKLHVHVLDDDDDGGPYSKEHLSGFV